MCELVCVRARARVCVRAHACACVLSRPVRMRLCVGREDCRKVLACVLLSAHEWSIAASAEATPHSICLEINICRASVVVLTRFPMRMMCAGHRCQAGMAKNTYGTGCFMILVSGESHSCEYFRRGERSV